MASCVASVQNMYKLLIQDAISINTSNQAQQVFQNEKQQKPKQVFLPKLIKRINK